MPATTDQCIHDVSLKEECQICVHNITKFFETCVDNITKFFETDSKVNDGRPDSPVERKPIRKPAPRETKENNDSHEFERIEKAKEMSEEVQAEEECVKQNISLPTSWVSPTERKKKKLALGSDPSRDSQNNPENLKEQSQIQEKPIIGQEVTNTNISQDNKVIDLQKHTKDKKKKKEKKKTKEFKDHELEDLRNDFARKQGVKEIKAVAPPATPAVSPIKEDIALVGEGAGEEINVVKSQVEESLYEPVGEERQEFVTKRLNQTNQREGREVNSDDDIIGFDLNTKQSETIETKKKPLEEKPDHVESLDPPTLPSRRKISKHSATNSQLSVEEKLVQKEKKSSFIREWQKDLKDFFTLRKKKISHTSSVGVPRFELESSEDAEHLKSGAEDANNK